MGVMSCAAFNWINFKTGNEATDQGIQETGHGREEKNVFLHQP